MKFAEFYAGGSYEFTRSLEFMSSLKWCSRARNTSDQHQRRGTSCITRHASAAQKVAKESQKNGIETANKLSTSLEIKGFTSV